MGKAQLERAKDNPFMRVEKGYWPCPKCGSALFSEHEALHLTMDGNTVYHCEQHDDHTFWNNSRGKRDTLYFNERATDSDFHYSEEYLMKDGAWVKVFPVDADVKEIIEWVNDMWHHTKDERLMCHTAEDIAWTIAQYMAQRQIVKNI